jgi:hypothetical protein
MKFIEREFPLMLPRFERLYGRKYPPDAYRAEVKGMVRLLQARYGLTRREEATTERRAGSDEAEGWRDGPDQPEQAGFVF